MYTSYRTPGVYLESVIPEKAFVLETGVPVFIGLVRLTDFNAARCSLTLNPGRTKGVFRVEPKGRVIWGYASGTGDYFPMFTAITSVRESLGRYADLGFLDSALQGFFENGGKKCFVHPVCYDETLCLPVVALECALAELENLAGADLMASPDLMRLLRDVENVSNQDALEMQNMILRHCAAVRGRFAVLDAVPHADSKTVTVQRRCLSGDNGALYHPWLKVVGSDIPPGGEWIPPSGHVCGIYARSDGDKGVHKAPANEEILGVADVETRIGTSEQDRLNPQHVNCIRSFPGRGIRIWGARTVSRYPEWTYVNVRRLVLTLERWLEGYMTRLVFEPNGPGLWGRIVRDVSGQLNGLFLAGAFKGRSAAEAFYVTCDSSVNTEDVRDLGRVVCEIGLAPASPCEFIIIRIVHSDGGTMITEGAGETGGQIPSQTGSSLPVMAVSHIQYSVEGPDISGEYAVIENRDACDVDLGNWTLRDKAGHVYTFPRITVPSGGFCRVWTRSGTDTSRDLFWGMNHAVWNNTGDEAVLRDRTGRTVNVYSYSGH